MAHGEGFPTLIHRTVLREKFSCRCRTWLTEPNSELAWRAWQGWLLTRTAEMQLDADPLQLQLGASLVCPCSQCGLGPSAPATSSAPSLSLVACHRFRASPRAWPVCSADTSLFSLFLGSRGRSFTPYALYIILLRGEGDNKRCSRPVPRARRLEAYDTPAQQLEDSTTFM